MPEFIPITAGVHFKCAFNVSSANVAKLMTHMRQMFRAWCVKRVGLNNPVLHRGWFYLGNNPKVEPAHYVINDHQLRTVSAPSADRDDPTCWALEMVHPDADERARRRSAEIILRKNDDGSVRFTSVVKNWMVANYIGEYPTPPDASAPSYVRALLDDRLLTCTKGTVRLDSRPVIVTNKTCQKLYDELAVGGRQVPFIFIAYNPETKGVLVPPGRIAGALIGNANVYLFSSKSVTDEMNYYLGDVLRCEYGSIRVYLPQFDKSDPGNGRLHRYLSVSHIAQHGEDGILRFLTNGLSRNGSTFRLSDFTSFADIFTERRKYTIKKLATESQSKSEEASLVWEDNEELTKKADILQSFADQYETENSELRQKLTALTYRVEEADRVRHRITDLESQCQGITKMAKLPISLSEILKTISALFPSRVKVMADALGSADDYTEELGGYWAKPEQLAIAWEMAFGLATKFYDMVFEENSNRLEEDFNEAFSSFELAMSEGKQTKKDSRLMALRQRVYEGQPIDITPHMNYGNRRPKLLRLYFAIRRDTKMFVIGHFGEHLENYSTRRQ